MTHRKNFIQQENEEREELIVEHMYDERNVELRERRLVKAEVTGYNFGEKALEAIYNGDTRLARAIIEKYVLPLQKK